QEAETADVGRQLVDAELCAWLTRPIDDECQRNQRAIGEIVERDRATALSDRHVCVTSVRRKLVSVIWAGPPAWFHDPCRAFTLLIRQKPTIATLGIIGTSAAQGNVLGSKPAEKSPPSQLSHVATLFVPSDECESPALPELMPVSVAVPFETPF